MTTLTKADIVQKICDDIGLSKNDSNKIIDDIMDILSDQIAQCDHVGIPKFGSFSKKHKNQRMGRNPKTGVEAVIASRTAITFKPSIPLKEKLNSQ